jgi:hypothetical protein
VIVDHHIGELAVEGRARQLRQLVVHRLLLAVGFRRQGDSDRIGHLDCLCVAGGMILHQYAAKGAHAVILALVLRQPAHLHLRQVSLDRVLDEFLAVLVGVRRRDRDAQHGDAEAKPQNRLLDHDAPRLVIVAFG